MGGQVECYCKRHWENVYKQLAAAPYSDSTTSNFSAGIIYKRLSYYELFDYILKEEESFYEQIGLKI